MKRTIRWEQILATGIHFMDQEHRELVDGVTRLEAAFAANDASMASKAFEAIVSHTQQHFENEELAMRQHRYAQGEYMAHKAEHDEFLTQLRFFQMRLGRCVTTMHGEILEFISAWMIAHILGQDRKMSLHLTAQAA